MESDRALGVNSIYAIHICLNQYVKTSLGRDERHQKRQNEKKIETRRREERLDQTAKRTKIDQLIAKNKIKKNYKLDLDNLYTYTHHRPFSYFYINERKTHHTRL